MVFTEGRADAEPVLGSAVTAFAQPDVSAEEMLRWGWLATVAAVYVWDYEATRVIATREVEVAREAGALEVLAVGVNIMSQAFSMGGDYAGAALLIAEAEAVREATGTLVGPYGALVLAGHRGHEAEAAGHRRDEPGGDTRRTGNRRAVRALRERDGDERPRPLRGGGRVRGRGERGHPELVVARWALSELIEAASRTQNAEVAERATAGLAEHATGTDSDWALGMLARARAAERRGRGRAPVSRGHRSPGPDRPAPDLARGRLLYGGWLRRQGRRVDAREQLRAAHDALASMGADAFAERARHELSQPARRCAAGAMTRATSSPRRRSRSRGSPATA